MGKRMIWSLVLLTLPAFVQAQESTTLQTTAKPDSLPALQKLNQDRGQRAAGGTQTGSKSASTGAKPSSAEKEEEAAGEELDLGTVSIQAVIEKPNVDIIPKRTLPDWEELGFLERSFGQELKEVPDELLLIDEELERAQKLETLKKADPPQEEK